MRNICIDFLKYVLRLLARMTISRYRPSVVGVTGRVGKTSTKEAISVVLRSGRTVRSSPANFNNEIGLPLSVISDKAEIEQPVFFFWPNVIFSAVKNLVFTSAAYPRVLVLEYGADRPGDIKRLLSIARPNVGVVTAIGEIPVHVEFFAGPQAIAKEKSSLVEALPADGRAALNFDDLTVLEMKELSRAGVVTFGFGEGADVRITNFSHRLERGVPAGISFKLQYGGTSMPVRIADTFGKAQAYAAAAAASVGLMHRMNLVTISEALGNHYRAPWGRMKLMKGLKDILVLDDSYNAAPLSMHAALDTLCDLPAKRKIAVLGDMLEIGKYALEAHEQVGRLVSRCCDMLVTVGPRAKFIAEGAVKNGFSRKNILNFDSAEDSLKPIRQLTQSGDLILVKASRAIHLEKVVEELKNPLENF